MIRIYILFLLLILSGQVYSAGPQRYEIGSFFPEAKVIATGTVLSGKAKRKKGSGEVCGVTFKVLIDESIIGPSQGKVVKVHHIIDNRYRSLEVGSKYFIYSEDRSTHSLMSLGDAIDMTLNDERPNECHQSGASYLYREFTHRIDSEGKYSWVGSFDTDAWAGIQQIKETRDLPRVYYSSGSSSRSGRYEYFLESRDFRFDNNNDIYGGALALEPLIELFKSEYKKSLNK